MRYPLVLVLSCQVLTAVATEQPVITTISAAKVFLSGAEVTRTGSVELARGTSTLLFAGLSDEVDPGNIQVSGVGAFTILGVQHRLNYVEEKKDRAEVLELQGRIRAMEADVAREQSLLAVLEKEDARLAKNDVIAGEQGLTLEQLRSVNDYLQGRQEALALKRLERQARIAQLTEEMNKLRLQLNRSQGDRPRPTSEVIVEVSANAPVQATLTLKYLVRSAGWSPNYDIRVADITKPLELIYKAQVYQSSGEDWANVQLALSSGEPNKDAFMPQLMPWRLDFGQVQPIVDRGSVQGYDASVRDVRGIIRDANTGEPIPFANVVLLDAAGTVVNGATSNMDGYYAAAVPATVRSLRVNYVGYQQRDLVIASGTMNIALVPSANQLQEVMVSGMRSEYRNVPARVINSTGRRIRKRRHTDSDQEELVPAVSAITSIAGPVVERMTNFEFSIPIPYSIPSDGQSHQVGVQEQRLPSNYRYYCTPKLELDAFLFAHVTGWEDLNLLAGPVHIYFEGTYVGESLLDLGGAGDTLDISLGRDKGLTVQRTKRKDYARRSVVGGKRTESVGWEIAVRNNKAQPVELVITDQYPVAARSEIEVHLDEDGGARVDLEKGFLTWKVQVAPRASQQWRFGYSVKVPKDEAVVLE